MSLEKRFQRECPHVDLTFLARNHPSLLNLGRRYNKNRAEANDLRGVNAVAEERLTLESKVAVDTPAEADKRSK